MCEENKVEQRGKLSEIFAFYNNFQTLIKKSSTPNFVDIIQ